MKRQIIVLFAAAMAAVCAETALGGEVPEAWKKARKLLGVATRATANPLQGTFELKCGKANGKGFAKVSAKLTGLDGKKKSYKAKAPVDVTVVPVTADLGGIVVTIDGDSFSGGDGLAGGLTVNTAKVGGALAGGEHTFNVEGFNPDVPGRLQRELLPLDSKFEVSGGKWKFAKGASVKWRKPKKGEARTPLYDEESGKDLMVDTSKGKTNVSSLKLTYKPKTGQFKGSFKVYVLEGEGKATKLKKYTVKVNGFVVDDEGVGRATCKKLAGGPWVATVDASKSQREGVQLWAGGPYWAECNVGATKPEGYGYYFWWGDTVGYTQSGGRWDGDSYVYGTWVSSAGKRMANSPFTESRSSCPTWGRENSELRSAGYIDSKGNLVAAHDAATAHWGSPWRMPTDAEFSALRNKCTTKWTTRNGVYGRLVTGNGAYADRSIFLPAAGFGDYSNHILPGSRGLYWSSTPDSGNPYFTWFLSFSSGSIYLGGSQYEPHRWFGMSVRPVR